MRDKLLGLATAATLLASVGVASAKGPVELTDAQLDKVTAGDATSSSQTALLEGISTTELDRLVTISDITLGFLNGVPLTSLTGVSLTPLTSISLTPLTLPP